jgi:Holliday junction resolvase RusA-like endonuclease
MIEFDVTGRPAPKGSRTQGKTKTGRSYTYPASKHEKPWVEAVREATRIVMRHHARLEPPYAVALEFRIAASKHARYAWPSQNDVDKLARAVVDGLVKGGALSDDRHVTALTSRKRFCAPGEQPGVHAFVSQDAQMQALRIAA